MRHHKGIVMIMLLTLVAIAGFSEAAQRAKITHLVGIVELRRAGTNKWRKARIGAPVSEKYDLRTFIESEAEVTLQNGSKLKIGEKSVVALARLTLDEASGSSKSTVKVSTGKIWANVKKLTETRSEFDFETPTAVASIRGTRLGINVNKKATMVDVYEGLVVVKKKGSRKAVNVSPNTRAIVDKAKNSVTLMTFKSVATQKSDGGDQSAPFDPFKADSAQGITPVDTAVSGSDTVRSTDEKTSDTSQTEQPAPDDSDEKGQSNEQSRTGSTRTVPLTLTLSRPDAGAVISEPLIMVSGRTVVNANVYVNDRQIPVGAEGGFTYRMPVPDEPYTYAVEIRAEYEGQEKILERKVTYQPKTQKLFLDVSSPLEGKEILGKTIHVTGKTAPMAIVLINRTTVPVSAAGMFSRDLPVSEKNIGEYSLDITARNDEDEISKMITVDVMPQSPQVNTSLPISVLSSGGQRAITQNFLSLQVLDRTPGDELTVLFGNNGVSEEITTENGRTEKLSLNEGKNSYSIQVRDLANNAAPLIKGEIYYLPGPVTLLLNEPASSYTVFDGLPPVLHPGYSTAEEQLDVEIEIDDGIGTVPESVRYCKVTGNGKTVILRNNNDYIYRGTVGVVRGTNQFVVQAEDLSGRLEILKFTVVLK